MTADEVKYGTAARLAQLDAQVLDLQQDMASCLHARKAAINEQIETAGRQLTNVQVSMIFSIWHILHQFMVLLLAWRNCTLKR